MSSKKSVTSSMSRKVSVAYTAKVMKNLPPANNGIDNILFQILWIGQVARKNKQIKLIKI